MRRALTITDLPRSPPIRTQRDSHQGVTAILPAGLLAFSQNYSVMHIMEATGV